MVNNLLKNAEILEKGAGKGQIGFSCETSQSKAIGHRQLSVTSFPVHPRKKIINTFPRPTTRWLYITIHTHYPKENCIKVNQFPFG